MIPIGRAMTLTVAGALGLLAAVTVGGFALLGWPGITQPDKLTVTAAASLKLVRPLGGSSHGD
jgi:hypothetical protein